MSNLIEAMCMLIKIFDEYAAEQGKKDTLTKAEARKLLERELGMEAKNPAEVDSVLNGLDADQDKEINFTEFMTLVAVLTTIIKAQ